MTTSLISVSLGKRIKIFAWMFRCFHRATKASLRGFIPLTDLVYGLEGGIEGGVQCGYVIDNDYGIEYAGSRGIYDIYALCHFVPMQSWEVEGLEEDILVSAHFYVQFWDNAVTDKSRFQFFYISFLVCPIVVTIMFVKEKEGGHGK